MNFLKLKSKQEGFTLIELLVVIAIISLLSSVVLASLRDARDKARKSAFRQEMNQFINALELYRSDKGYYPFPVSEGAYVGRDEKNMITKSLVTDPMLTEFYKYIPNIPNIVSPKKTAVYPSWWYIKNPSDLDGAFYTCEKNAPNYGPESVPPYVITVYGSDKETYEAVKDWGYTWTWDTSDPAWNQNAILEDFPDLCFSIK